MNKLTAYMKSDILSGLVVFLVSVPLCLGIALASGAPLFSGMISGMIGGLVVGFISKSPISVSGPAAGLTAIVLSGINTVGSFQGLLVATVIAGIFQLILGFVKAGTIGYYFPSNVIKGMLTAIGIIIILKQIPHFFGYDQVIEGDEAFTQNDGHNTISTLYYMIESIHLGVLFVGMISASAMLLWDKYKPKQMKMIPGAFLCVIVGVLTNFVFINIGFEQFIITQKHLVTLPVPENIPAFFGQFTNPDFSHLLNKDVWILALTIGIVASIETLLTIEATDKLDPLKRFTDSNTELLAQGTGNILSGLIGGLPITSVIVRSSANLNAGAKSKLSTMLHGFFILIGVAIIPSILNYIPLTSLAAILLVTGYKLANPKIFIGMFKMNKYQWFPFIVTVLGVVFTDLLIGVTIGMIIAVGAILIGNMKNTYYFHSKSSKDQNTIRLELSQEVSFLNKAALTITLDKIPEKSTLILDATHTFYIDFDVLEMIREFETIKAPIKNIKLVMKGFKEEYGIRNNDHIFYGEVPETSINGVPKVGTKSEDVLKDLKHKGHSII